MLAASDVAESPAPALGFTVPYAIGNILLTILAPAWWHLHEQREGVAVLSGTPGGKRRQSQCRQLVWAGLE